MDNFSAWLQDQLNKKKMNQAELAEATHTTPATVSRLMGGTRKPGSKLCISIAKVLDVSPEEVFVVAGLLPKKTSSQIPDTVLYKYSILNKNNQSLAVSFMDLLIGKQDK